MVALKTYRKLLGTVCVAASFALSAGSAPAEPTVQELVQDLGTADVAESNRIMRELELIWSRSGSPTMDLLLRRGRDAMEAGDLQAAKGHLSALTDHAPDFAEGWRVRAQVYFREEEFGLALADLQQALALSPWNFDVVYGMSLILEELGRTGDAYAGYRAILDIYPNHEQALAGADRLARSVGGSDI